jgi:hypothetical protein
MCGRQPPVDRTAASTRKQRVEIFNAEVKSLIRTRAPWALRGKVQGVGWLAQPGKNPKRQKPHWALDARAFRIVSGVAWSAGPAG